MIRGEGNFYIEIGCFCGGFYVDVICQNDCIGQVCVIGGCDVFQSVKNICQMCWFVVVLVFLRCQMNVCVIGIVVQVRVMEGLCVVLCGCYQIRG